MCIGCCKLQPAAGTRQGRCKMGTHYPDQAYTQALECNNGREGVNFAKVKHLVAKWIGTRKRFSLFF